MKYIGLSILCLLLTITHLTAQDLGNYPTDLNWQILESPIGNVIFPKGNFYKLR